jgi:hypothetical protein
MTSTGKRNPRYDGASTPTSPAPSPHHEQPGNPPSHEADDQVDGAILRLSGRPDGTDRSPMRASEAKLTLSIVSLRDGDVDGATEWARKAFSIDRRSVNSLSTVADELYHEARAQYGDDPAIGALNDVIASFYASVSDR